MGGKANTAVSAKNHSLLITLSNIPQSLIVGAVFVVVLIAVLYWFFGTELGHSIRATGCNSNMARANGINTNFNTIIALVLSNGSVGVSGGLYAQYTGFADYEYYLSNLYGDYMKLPPEEKRRTHSIQAYRKQ